MAWCPKCKSEYVEGVTRCADCDCELVEEKELEEEKMSSWEEEIALRALALKKAEEELLAREEDDQEEAEAEEFAFENPPEEKPRYVTHYVNNEEKAEENRTSAYTLLIVGTLGLVLVILFFFDILPIHRLVSNKYMVSGVMGTMFILFIIMGVVSMKNSRNFAKKAHKENNLTKEIKKWCTESMTMEAVDSQLSLEEASEEIKYFQRTDRMKAMIQNQYMNLDEGYLDRLIDEIYPEIFEDGQA